MKTFFILGSLGFLAATGITLSSVSDTREQIKTAPTQAAKCHPSYSGCLTPGIGDYDCRGGSGDGPNYTGKVQVLGPDVFRLDRDGDGTACDRS